MSLDSWISGTRGFIGKHLIKKLTNEGQKFSCVSKTGSNNIIGLNFSDNKSFTSAFKMYGVPNTFIHLGWGNVYDPHHKSHLNENLQDGKNIINNMYDNGVRRIIHIGSSSEYGERTGPLDEKFIESKGKINNYVKGKISLAKYGLEMAHKYNAVFIHVRLYYTYGSGQQHNSLINQLYKNSISNNIMELSPCEQFRDYIYVEDAVNGIYKISNVNQSGILNLGSGNTIQLKEFVKKFWHLLGMKANRLKFGSFDQPLLEQKQPKAYADLTKLRKLTGWVPNMKIDDGIKLTIDQLRKINI